jgi:hypothetical protein
MHIIDYRDHTGSSAEKFFKSTLFQSSRLLLGLNCLEPGQTQATHMHADRRPAKRPWQYPRATSDATFPAEGDRTSSRADRAFFNHATPRLSDRLPDHCLGSGYAWGAFVHAQLAAVACSFFVGSLYEEVGVVTEAAHRGQG